MLFAAALCSGADKPAQAGEGLRSPLLRRQELYRQSGIGPSSIRTTRTQDRTVERVKVPRNIPLVDFAFRLWSALQPLSPVDVLEKGRGPSRCIEVRFREENRDWLIVLGYGDPLRRFALVLVLEGLETAEPWLVEEFVRISPSFGYVVPPAFLSKACLLLQNRGELLVQLPLEPVRSQPGGPAPILLQSPAPEVRKSLGFLRSPACPVAGVVPPENSVVLGDERMTTIVLEEIRKRKTYFLELKPMRNSLASGAAAAAGVHYLACRERLSRNADTSEVQMRRLIVAAGKTGKAIAAGRVSEPMLATIHKLIPELEVNGMEFCLPSALIFPRQQ